MKMIFVRHGKDDDRYRGGWNQLDLIAEGHKQAQQLAKYLKEYNSEYKITHIISSDLPRAKTTAKYIANELNLPMIEDRRIRETNNGDLAGMLNDEALKKYPGLFFGSLEMDEPYPNGESPQAFYLRIKTWFEDFMAEHENMNENTLIVTHSGVINIIYHLVNHILWNNQSNPHKISHCSIHVLNLETGKFEIENKIDFLIEA